MEQEGERLKATLTLVVIAISLLLQACGGGSSEGDELSARERADAVEAKARALLQTAPCTSDSQCSFVTFQDAFPSCSQGRHEAYLLTSRAAAIAASLAAEQRQLAREAQLSNPGGFFVCTAHVEPLPVPACVQNKCVLKFGFEPIDIAPQ